MHLNVTQQTIGLLYNQPSTSYLNVADEISGIIIFSFQLHNC